MIRIVNMEKAYENITPLKDINAVINEGDVIAIIGPSGCGKSTFIRCINMLEKPTKGHIYFNDTEITDPATDITKVRQKLGMVFQQFNLFNHLTVVENIMFAPTEILKTDKKIAYDEAMALLRRVGLAEKALSYPDELSGGQQQRVAIARTLAMDPEVILFDEPTSALDPSMVGEVESVIYDLKSEGKTMMIVTHDMNFAYNIATRVFYIDEGIIYEEGTPQEIFDDPKKENTQRFIFKRKSIEISILSHDHDFLTDRTAIESFCARNRLSPKLANRIGLVFEEMTQQILLPRLPEPVIGMLIDFSEKTGDVIIRVKYNGEKFDPKDSENELSYEIISHICSSIEYVYKPEDVTGNRMLMRISQE